MNGRKARAARREQGVPRVRSQRSGSSWLVSWQGALVGLAAVALVGASFVLPRAFDAGTAAAGGGVEDASASAAAGDGLEPGAAVPQFAERDVTTGKAITSRSLRGRTLLFFSEGVMCQACFEQIKGLEQMTAELDKRGIRLVSVTPDSPADLEQAIGQYGIETPMIADEDRDMSAAFDTLGQGMHGDAPGHAFALVERGKVLWYRDYWLAPSQTMYVEPAQVLADLPAT